MSRRNKPKSVGVRPSPKPTDFHHDPKPRYVKQPRIFCTLHPETNAIQIELPGPNGRRQPITVNNLETIRNILMHQLELSRNADILAIGEVGDPTEAQVRHWEDHANRNKTQKLQSQCPFCIAEGRAPVRRFDTRGRPIRIVNDPAELGF
jgi:hypothetical protein